MRFLTFDALITPTIIRLVFYLAVALSCVGAMAAYVSISSPSPFFPGSPGLALIAAIAVLVVGVVLSRIGAELILVVFMIRDELAWQRQGQERLRDLAAD
jgi:hypothetical protein